MSKKKLAVLFLLPNSSKKFIEQKRSFRSLFLLLGNTLPPLLHEIWTKFFRLTPCKSFIKRCKVRKKYANILQHIQFINDVSQMSSIYDEVSILAYKILIKKHMYSESTIREWNNYNIVTKYVDKLNNHYQEPLKKNTMTRGYKYDTP